MPAMSMRQRQYTALALPSRTFSGSALARPQSSRTGRMWGLEGAVVGEDRSDWECCKGRGRESGKRVSVWYVGSLVNP